MGSYKQDPVYFTSSFIYSKLIAVIRAKMKEETTYIQTHTLAYEILNHAHKYCMAKQLTMLYNYPG